jgi:hypothetical protein
VHAESEVEVHALFALQAKLRELDELMAGAAAPSRQCGAEPEVHVLERRLQMLRWPHASLTT